MLEGREVIIELLHRDFGINLGGGDVRMARNPTDALDGYPLVECQHGKAMSGAMQSDMFVESTFVHHPMNPFGHRAVFHRGENGLSIYDLLIALLFACSIIDNSRFLSYLAGMIHR